MRYLIIGLMLFLSLPFNGVGQERQIYLRKGRVLDVNGNTVPNAGIKAIKSGRTASADSKGQFEIYIWSADTIVITAVGFKTKRLEEINKGSFFTVELEPLEYRIDEVEVNTGYQKLKPNQVNSSITVLNKSLLDKQVGVNILERLNGVTNGLTFQTGRTNLNPQNKLGITIRGYGTLNGALDPLVVLDDF